MDQVRKPPKLNGVEWGLARQRAIASLDAVCSICHRPIDLEAPKNTPFAVEVDHIVPRSRGGDLYALENLQLTHHSCNRKKGARMASDYVGQEVTNPVPLSNAW